MRRQKAFTLVELVMTIAIVGIMAGAFVSLFVPQIQLFLYLPTNLRVQEASSLMMETMVNGKMTVVQIGLNRVATFVPGLKYAEPAAATGKLVNLTGITYADPTEVRYNYFDAKRATHTARLFLNANTSAMVRLVDTETETDLKIISSNGARSTGGIRIQPVPGSTGIFKYYQQNDSELTTTPLSAADLNNVSRIDIAFVADTGGSDINSYQSSNLKRSSVSIKRRFYPEPGEWEFQFAKRNAVDTLPDLYAIKKHDGGTTAGSANTEVHIFDAADTGSGNFGAETSSTASNLGESGDHFDFFIADCGNASSRTPDGTQDLVAIQKILNSSGRVELRAYNGTNFAAAPMVNVQIGNGATDRRLLNGVEEYEFGMGNYRARGAAVDATNTQDLFVALLVSGKVNVRVFNGVGNYTAWFASSGDGPYITTIPTIDSTTNLWSYWKFLFVNWNADTYVDMVAIHKKRTASGFVEVTVLDGQPRSTSSTGTPTGNGTTSSTGTLRFQGILTNFSVTVPAQTIIPAVTGNNLDFRVADWNNDGTPDLICVQRNQTVSGSTVVRILSGIPSLVGTNQVLDNVLLQTGTAMPEVDNGKSLP